MYEKKRHKWCNTDIEKITENELKRRKLFYLPQQPIGGFVLVDFYLPDQKIIIECDGDYWHNRPEIKEKDRKNKRNLKN
uniref:DUF559 domain-containing protein n=1 Tax=Dictyoglomus turgidum TaxID=513050 RepID=A0A7C3SNC3_9BACT